MNARQFPIPVRSANGVDEGYDCARCPAYCCSYPLIEVDRRDIGRLARHFGIGYEQAEARFTKVDEKVRVLRHRRDDVFRSACMFLDREARHCMAYDARPGVCRTYPDAERCGYWEFLRFEREQQDDPQHIALT